MTAVAPIELGGVGTLSRRVAASIVEFIKDQPEAAEQRLTEQALATALKVSRTPVRAALGELVRLGIVVPAGARRGYRITASPERLDRVAANAAPGDDIEQLYVRVAQDHLLGRLNEQLSEAELLRTYRVSRATLRRTLQRMAADGVVERNPGYRWRFVAGLATRAARAESYRFRLVVEPAAIGEPDYTLDRDWARRARRDHDTALDRGLAGLSAVRFFAMNADFHEMVAAGSGNSFFRAAVRQQNQLRRFYNYGWAFTEERVATNCLEHLAILDALQERAFVRAALLMRAHLQVAADLETKGDEPGDIA